MIARLLLLLGGLAPAWAQAQNGTRLARYQTEKFKLSAGPCAAEGYFVMIQGGAFVNATGKGFPVPSGHVLEGSWGASGTSWVVGDPQQLVPERLKLLWFAYAEDKFYEGNFALPQESIYRLLKQGYWDADKRQPDTYHKFTVCVLPKGVVVVWLTGGNQTLVGRFQAAETFPTPAAFQRYYGEANRASFVKYRQAQMPAYVQAEIKAGTISTKKWDAYLKTYPWQLAFNVPFALDQPYAIGYRNGEYTNSPLTRELAPYFQALLAPGPKPVPKDAVLFGRTEHGARYKLRLQELDEAETMAAFQALHAASPQSPITLLVTFDKPFTTATLSLKNETKEIPLPKSIVKVFLQE